MRQVRPSMCVGNGSTQMPVQPELFERLRIRADGAVTGADVEEEAISDPWEVTLQR